MNGHLTLVQPQNGDTTPALAQRLNFDVLSMIFSILWETSRRSELIVSSVCRHWRDVALSTPRLWSRTPTYSDCEKTSPTERMKTYLARSQQLPLHIRFVSRSGPTPEDHRRALLAAADRFQCLESWLDDGIAQASFPILKRVTLYHLIDRGETLPRWTSFLDRAKNPMLESLDISSLQAEVIRPIVSAVLPQGFPPLRTLSLPCDGQPHFLSIVNHCADTLISLTITVPHRGGPGDYRLALPRLRYLEIREPVYPVNVRLRFNTPLLTSFNLYDVHYSSPRLKPRFEVITDVTDVHTSVYEFTVATHPRLRNLWLTYHYGWHGQQIDRAPLRLSLRKALKHCPALESIKYYYKKQGHEHAWEKGKLDKEPAFLEMIGEEVRRAGRSVTVAKFDPREMLLPGANSIQPECQGCEHGWIALR